MTRRDRDALASGVSHRQVPLNDLELAVCVYHACDEEHLEGSVLTDWGHPSHAHADIENQLWLIDNICSLDIRICQSAGVPIVVQPLRVDVYPTSDCEFEVQ